MNSFKKVINPCSVLIGKQYARVFCEIEFTDGKLSIHGVIGPTRGGNARGGCGQIDMEFRPPKLTGNESSDYYAKKRYTELWRNLRFYDGWYIGKFKQFLAVWDQWHLNDMRSGCEHQRALGWTYEDHHNKDTFKGENCPTCGYSIGSSWLFEAVPDAILNFLVSLPDSKITPAWV